MSNGLQKTLSTGALIATMGMIGIAAASRPDCPGWAR